MPQSIWQSKFLPPECHFDSFLSKISIPPQWDALEFWKMDTKHRFSISCKIHWTSLSPHNAPCYSRHRWYLVSIFDSLITRWFWMLLSWSCQYDASLELERQGFVTAPSVLVQVLIHFVNASSFNVVCKLLVSQFSEPMTKERFQQCKNFLVQMGITPWNGHFIVSTKGSVMTITI